jgi:hypothetical protein
MATQKTRNLTVETLTVTGTINGVPVDSTPAPEPEETVNSAPAPAQLDRADFGDRPTCKELAQAYHDLYDALTRADFIVPRAVPQDAPQSAPETVEVQTPVIKDESGTQGTPQAITAGVVDGA